MKRASCQNAYALTHGVLKTHYVIVQNSMNDLTWEMYHNMMIQCYKQVLKPDKLIYFYLPGYKSEKICLFRYIRFRKKLSGE